MLAGIIVADLVVATGLALTHGEAVSGGASGGVGDGSESDDSTDDDGGSSGATSTDERVAVVIIGFHGYCGQGKVGAVYTDHGCLGESGTRIGVLDGRVDREDSDYDDEDEIDLEIDLSGGVASHLGGRERILKSSEGI